MFAYRRKKRSNIFVVPVKVRCRKIQISWRVWLWGVAVVAALSGLLYLAIWSPVFKIKKLSVEGVNFTATAQAQELVNQLLQEKTWRVIPGDSLVIFSGQEAVRRILTFFPEAESVEISRDILKGVKIIIKGRQPAAIWCKSSASFLGAGGEATSTEAVNVLPPSEKCFFTDSAGLIFREAPEISGTAWPTFFGQIDQNFGPGSQAIASSTIQFAGQLKKQLREISIDSPGFVIGASDSQDLAAFTNEGWMIYFNVSRSSQSQVKVLRALLNGGIKDKRASLKYIDLRLANRVYYK